MHHICRRIYPSSSSSVSLWLSTVEKLHNCRKASVLAQLVPDNQPLQYKYNTNTIKYKCNKSTLQIQLKISHKYNMKYKIHFGLVGPTTNVQTVAFRPIYDIIAPSSSRHHHHYHHRIIIISSSSSLPSSSCHHYHHCIIIIIIITNYIEGTARQVTYD